MPDKTGQERTIRQTLTEAGAACGRYKVLQTFFWASHPTWGEPDLLLVFSGGHTPPLVVLVEAKLWSGKSGTGKWDQLVRYLSILDDLPAMGLNLPPGALRFLVYLTRRDSLDEVRESVELLGPANPASQRLFRLRWQDIVEAARAARASLLEPGRTILSDVTSLLQKRGLEYFDGFRTLAWLPSIAPAPRFRGFAKPALERFTIRKAGWII